jgi:plastocyanin
MAFNFVLISKPAQILITPGGNLTYPRISVLSLPSALPSGTEKVALSVTTPNGISVGFYVKALNISINAQMSLQGGADPPYSLLAVAAAPSVAPGDYKVTVTGTSGSLTETNSFTVRVVQNLIVVKDKAYNPSHLTVKAGSTVYWLSLGLPSVGDNAQEYDVAFKTINVASTVLYGYPIYDSFSYTFTTPGTYDYACVQANDCPGPYMTGQITVTA